MRAITSTELSLATLVKLTGMKGVQQCTPFRRILTVLLCSLTVLLLYTLRYNTIIYVLDINYRTLPQNYPKSLCILTETIRFIALCIVFDISVFLSILTTPHG